MASSDEIAASLAMEDIPIKLRCAACNKLAVNAFRMPCCDQSICEECQEALPQACPVCLHEPVNKDDCKPNKALRTTIKVFLKKKGVEREAARKKEMVAKAAATPATPATPIVEETSARQLSQPPALSATQSRTDLVEVKQEPRDASQMPKAASGTDEAPSQSGVPSAAQMDIPQQSIESPGPQGASRRASTQTVGDGSLAHDNGDDVEQTKKQEQASGIHGQWPQGNGAVQGMNNNVFGLEGMNGGFPNMGNLGMGDFNQMMQFMPNGMPNNMMGQFPHMMGMPGMGMDPMAMSQGMYGNFGGPGMGMNGMNMGMGFDAGQGAFGGFNGQPQAFNQNSYGGGNMGANAGYGGNNMPPHQGNFNQMHQHQNFNNDFQHGYHNQGFQNRGRGRGRGGFVNAGRGRGYPQQVPQAYQGRQANNESFQIQQPQQNGRRGSPVYGEMQGSGTGQQPQQQNPVSGQESKPNDTAAKQSADEQLIKELDPGDAEDNIEIPKSPVEEAKTEEIRESVQDEQQPAEQKPEADTALIEDSKPVPIPSILSDETTDDAASRPDSNGTAPSAMLPPSGPIIPTGPASLVAGVPAIDSSPRGRGFGRGYGRGYSDFRPASRGRGSIPPFDNSSRSQSTPSLEQPVQSPLEPKGLGVEGAPKGPKALRQGAPNVGVKPTPPQDAGFSIVGRASAGAQARTNGAQKSPSEAPIRSPSRSPSRHQSSHHRPYRQRSPSPAKESEREKRKERHERSSRGDDDHYEDSRDTKEPRTRDASTHSSTKRSSHRSHRDHNKDYSRSKHRSHRSQRDRSRSPEKERRSDRKRSRTPDLRTNGASRAKDIPTETRSSRRDEKNEDEARASRKRRERDDEGHDHDRKRSRRDDNYAAENQDTGHRSKHSRREEKDSKSSNVKPSKAPEKSVEAPADPPKAAKVDQHALEREARNRERQMKEIQRRALMEGKGTGAKSKPNGRAGERRSSYKYEDEDLTSRVERERESKRWG